MHIKTFIFNPVQENTYLLYDETGECAIIDAGCLFPQEENALADFIGQHNLSLKHVLNTHLHFDHAFGNAFLAKKYGILPEAHDADEFLLPSIKDMVKRFGLDFDIEPQQPGKHLAEGDTVRFGNTELKVIHTPGHSPGGLCFYCKKDGVLFSGDTLFLESIGRSDLPGGNYDALIDSITKKLLTLPPDTVVYPGHDETTTIGHEKRFNPYF
ncbi:MAG: MBL fold metallo-hydrolase [Prevotellaceae bacterium]|jgi:glyoxylase-like metal-dependent hydrolase (beta-lactamase superfamily II)|nr:MBL fold metallo-hydrolase [Prevotellaceae bacterium]